MLVSGVLKSLVPPLCPSAQSVRPLQLRRQQTLGRRRLWQPPHPLMQSLLAAPPSSGASLLACTTARAWQLRCWPLWRVTRPAAAAAARRRLRRRPQGPRHQAARRTHVSKRARVLQVHACLERAEPCCRLPGHTVPTAADTSPRDAPCCHRPAAVRSSRRHPSAADLSPLAAQAAPQPAVKAYSLVRD